MPARLIAYLLTGFIAGFSLAACAAPPEPSPQPVPVAARACHTPPEVVGQVLSANPGSRVLGFLTGEKAAEFFRMLAMQGATVTGDGALLFTDPEETVLFVVTFVNGCADRQITLRAGAA